MREVTQSPAYPIINRCTIIAMESTCYVQTILAILIELPILVISFMSESPGLWGLRPQTLADENLNE